MQLIISGSFVNKKKSSKIDRQDTYHIDYMIFYFHPLEELATDQAEPNQEEASQDELNQEEASQDELSQEEVNHDESIQDVQYCQDKQVDCMTSTPKSVNKECK